MKYDQLPYGRWERDENNLPALNLDAGKLPRLDPAWTHFIGNGRLLLSADPWGRLRLAVPDLATPAILTPVGPGYRSACRISLRSEDRDIPLALSEMSDTAKPRITWGLGYVRYAADPLLDDDASLRFSLEAAVAPDGEALVTLVLKLRHTRKVSFSFELEIATDLEDFRVPADPRHPLRHLCRNGIAMVPDLHPGAGDLFLAGDPSWKAEIREQALRLHRPVTLKPREDLTATLILGFRRDCSLNWITQQYLKADHAATRAAWAAKLMPATPRGPDLWMQDECLWNAGAVSLNCIWDSAVGKRLLLPECFCQIRNQTAIPGMPLPLPVRETLWLCPAIYPRDPELALQTLCAVTAAQAPNGRLPEFTGTEPDSELDPFRDRSDLELTLLNAWAEIAETAADPQALLQMTVPFATGETATVSDHLRQALRWLKEEIGTGRHNLIHLLAGDSNGWLNRAGVAGRGESVLNSAMAASALGRLATVYRRGGDMKLADKWEAWALDLRRAVGEAFSGKWFARGYNDQGDAFGTDRDGRLFLEAQAWAVLGLCGTARQRDAALASALELNRSEAGLLNLSPAYPLLPPANLSSLLLPAGEGENGGIALLPAFWFIRALAVNRLKTEAMTEWEKLALRALFLQIPDISPQILQGLSCLNAAASGSRMGGPALTGLDTAAGAMAALPAAWREFALRGILAG